MKHPAIIFIGTSSRFAKGVGDVWRYILTRVGLECIYMCMEPPSTMHAGDCAYCGRGCGGNLAVCVIRRVGAVCSSISNFGVLLGGWSA